MYFAALVLGAVAGALAASTPGIRRYTIVVTGMAAALVYHLWGSEVTAPVVVAVVLNYALAAAFVWVAIVAYRRARAR